MMSSGSQFFILSLVLYDANSEGVSDVLMCTIILRCVCVCVCLRELS